MNQLQRQLEAILKQKCEQIITEKVNSNRSVYSNGKTQVEIVKDGANYYAKVSPPSSGLYSNSDYVHNNPSIYK